MILTKTLSFLVWAVVTLWSRTITVLQVNREVLDRYNAEGRNVIYAFWHDSMFLLPFTHRNSRVVIMVSESRDGEIAAGTLRRFGFQVVRGSTKRKGHSALIGLINSMRRGRSVAIAVDGPRGPRHETKQGVVFLAAKLQAPIIPMATWAKRSWTLEKAWDRFIVPAPFTSGVVRYGEPIMVNGTSRDEIAFKRRELEMALHRLTQEAEALVAAPGHGKRSAIKNESSPARLCEKDRQRRAGASRL
jgi:lysophospholipid acyltransferase (LPLAT)-like uncharacterized protein